MLGISYDYEQEYNNDQFDLFLHNDYLFPLQTRDVLDNNALINSENNNFEFDLLGTKDNINNDKENNNNNNTNNNCVSKTTKIIIKFGRKSKGEIRQVVHTKFCEDNIIKKIKTYLMKYLDKKLNNSLHFTYKRFYKLNKTINDNLKKDYNIRLMNMSIREIYEENSPRKIYDPSVKKKNYDLIQEIYDKNEEKETIEILNTKYIDFLNKLETKEYIINEIEKKIKNQNDKIDDIAYYMSKVRKLLEYFKEWFTNKLDRKYKSKQKK